MARRFVLGVEPRDADAAGYYDLRLNIDGLPRQFRGEPCVDRLCRKMDMTRSEVLRHFTPGAYMKPNTAEVSLNAGYDPEFDEGLLEVLIWAIVSREVFQVFTESCLGSKGGQAVIPARVIAKLRDPQPTAADFTATKFTPTESKVWFTIHFLRFVSSDFPKHQFTKRFYCHIMYTFGFIAHYDLGGFWTEYFTSTAGKVEFLEQVISWPCHGDATHTFCDAEREIARRLKAADLLGLYRARLRNEEHAHERAELARLKAKYEARPALIEPTAAPSLPRRQSTAQPPIIDRIQLAFALG